VHNMPDTPDNVCSEPVTDQMKCTNSAVGCPLNDEKVPSDDSPPPSSSSLLSRQVLSVTSSNFDRRPTSTEVAPLYTASPNPMPTESDEQSQFPLSDEYEFRLVCDMCFKPKTEKMTKTSHSCRQDMLAVKIAGTSQWYWIRHRKTFVIFKGDYAMCTNRQCGRRCFNGCTYAHCEAERQLWNMEKKSTFSIAKFISDHQISAPISSVKSLLDKYPVS